MPGEANLKASSAPEPDMEDEELTADEIIAAQRARRQALLAKLLAQKNESESVTPQTPSERYSTPQPGQSEMPFTSKENNSTREASLQPSQNGGAGEYG